MTVLSRASGSARDRSSRVRSQSTSLKACVEDRRTVRQSRSGGVAWKLTSFGTRRARMHSPKACRRARSEGSQLGQASTWAGWHASCLVSGLAVVPGSRLLERGSWIRGLPSKALLRDPRAPQRLRRSAVGQVPIPESSADFARLRVLRPDAESINRGIEDSLFINRASAKG